MSERNISNYQGCFQLVFKNIELSIMEGGQTAAAQTVCGCVCVGPVTKGKSFETLNSDVDCADCGASNAHRVSN
mgnify:CR=1 FL=1